MKRDTTVNQHLFNYFEQVELPAPALSAGEIEALLRDQFHVTATAEPLGSQQDQNFLLRADASGDPFGVLKVANPVFSQAEIDLRTVAAEVVASTEPSIRVPRLVEGPLGELAGWWDTSGGRFHVRVLEFISGRTLTGSNYLSPVAVARMGELSARASRALADVTHAASARVHQWDLQHAGRVVETLEGLEPDDRVRNLVRSAADQALAVLSPIQSQLRRQIGHFDITDDNVMSPEAPGSLPDAIIDFGDVSESWLVADVAVTVSSLLHHDGLSPLSTVPAIQAFHAIRPLSEEEADALWPLVVLRGAVLVLSGRHQMRFDENNDYASDALDREFRILEQSLSVPMEVMSGLIRAALGMPPASAQPEWQAPPVLSLEGRIAVLEPGTTSELNDDGAWQSKETLGLQALKELDAGAAAVILPFGRFVLTGAPALSMATPATFSTATTLWLAKSLPLNVPSTAELNEGPDAIRIHLGGVTLSFSVTDTARPSATLPARTAISVQLLREDSGEVPPRVEPGYAAGWLSLLDDPGPALGLGSSECPPHPERDSLLRRRHDVLADVQEYYFDRPPQVERGWREYLMSTEGRVYLDMVNNVTSVGHAHPRVAAAAARQLRLINTNSRFNYAAITDFAESVAATLPDELDTVFFVNSGSEATDLSIRLAMAATGRSDVVAMRESYHGWTYASDAVSTSIADNPQAVSTRPDWVHTVDAANSYRGRHRGAEAHRYAAEAAAHIRTLAAEGAAPAAFICESFFGNAGGVALPPGYLQTVYGTVRELGGVAIADEVQVGYGRLGEWFWGFQQQGVVPDIVAVAKSVGNGQPIGIVVTSRAIADRYRTQGYFFSSTGGSPLSSVIGMTVLDIIEKEGLQENARLVGGHLKRRLEQLAESYEIIGAVHGSGLYLGLELVRSRKTLEPATEETGAICSRLLELGVIVQPTGDHLNVLKIKPPLCVSEESVNFFADALEGVLRTGW